ncbi:MAG: phosphoglycerate mutase family protein, partial [Ruminococcaceae bacterium]|nr:phosphoglycerate mutase family protein [Oscillospiraceae bacterium]
MQTTIIFVRHGQSEANTEKYFAGHFDAPLTDTGRE